MKTEKIKAPFWAYLLSAALVLLLIGVLLLPSYLNTHMDGEIQNFAEMENAFRAVAEDVYKRQTLADTPTCVNRLMAFIVAFRPALSMS